MSRGRPNSHTTARGSTSSSDPKVLTYSESDWKHLRHQGVRLKRLVTQDLPPLARESAWENFKQLSAEHGDWLPWVISQTEPQYAGMFKRFATIEGKGL
jgi:hypothetical protein